MSDPITPGPSSRLSEFKSWVDLVLHTIGYMVGCGLIVYMTWGYEASNRIPQPILVIAAGLAMGINIIVPAISPVASWIAAVTGAVVLAVRGKKGE